MTWNVEQKPQNHPECFNMRPKLKKDMVRKKSRAMQILEHTLLLNYSYPPDHRQHCYSFPSAFYLWPLCLIVRRSLRSFLCFHSTFHFHSTNQSPAQFTSDTNLCSIAMLIPAASHSRGQMQRKKREEGRGGGILNRLNTAMPLVSFNLSELLSQVFPVHSCIPFRSLKIAEKVYK